MKRKLGICVHIYKALEGNMAYSIHVHLQQAVFTMLLQVAPPSGVVCSVTQLSRHTTLSGIKCILPMHSSCFFIVNLSNILEKTPIYKLTVSIQRLLLTILFQKYIVSCLFFFSSEDTCVQVYGSPVLLEDMLKHFASNRSLFTASS